MTNTIETSFANWESHHFGFGYGTGEKFTLDALKAFMENIDQDDRYSYRVMENSLGATVTWLLINILCRADILEYGTSPRFGWLTTEGKRLREFVISRTVGELYNIVTNLTLSTSCTPAVCNCGPSGYEKDRKCVNPFWK